MKTTENCSKKPSEIRKNRTNPTEKLEEVFSNPTLFKAYVDSAEKFYAKFDKHDFFTAQFVASKILQTKTNRVKLCQTKIAVQMAKKYRFVLLGQQKVVGDPILNDDFEIVEEKTNKNTKDMEIVDQHDVSCSSTWYN